MNQNSGNIDLNFLLKKNMHYELFLGSSFKNFLHDLIFLLLLTEEISVR